MANIEQPAKTIFDEIYHASNETFKRYSTRLSYSKMSRSLSSWTESSESSDEPLKKIEIEAKNDTNKKRITIKFLSSVPVKPPSKITVNELNVEKILLKPRKIVYKDKSEHVLSSYIKNPKEDKTSAKSKEGRLSKNKRDNVKTSSKATVSALKSDKSKGNKKTLVTRFKDENHNTNHCIEAPIPELDSGFESMRINLDNLEKSEHDCKCKEKFSTVTVASIFESNEMVIENLFESINTNENGLVNVTDVIRVLNLWNKTNRDCYVSNDLKLYLKSIEVDGFIDNEQFKSVFLYNLLH
ncbi:unnamed protein product [Brachionus calyciflorus]|uniref:EF-hand domain-containing protein n=1 Tax=Brachionus calyciflorus TaxID=104777 RepID=A0A813QE84_9BILA|nr:unnamed protein product [Brachionus calyciflorus]